MSAWFRSSLAWLAGRLGELGGEVDDDLPRPDDVLVPEGAHVLAQGGRARRLGGVAGRHGVGVGDRRPAAGAAEREERAQRRGGEQGRQHQERLPSCRHRVLLVGGWERCSLVPRWCRPSRPSYRGGQVRRRRKNPAAADTHQACGKAPPTTGSSSPPTSSRGARSASPRPASPAALARALARERRVDLHALIELTERGCPPETAARILAPLDAAPAGARDPGRC